MKEIMLYLRTMKRSHESKKKHWKQRNRERTAPEDCNLNLEERSRWQREQCRLRLEWVNVYLPVRSVSNGTVSLQRRLSYKRNQSKFTFQK